MCKEHFIKHKTGYLTGLIIALFAVAAVLLARAGYLGESAFNLAGDIGRFGRVAPVSGIRGDSKVVPDRIAPRVIPTFVDPTGRIIPDRISPIGIDDPQPPKVAPDAGRIAPTGEIDPGIVRINPSY